MGGQQRRRRVQFVKARLFGGKPNLGGPGLRKIYRRPVRTASAPLTVPAVLQHWLKVKNPKAPAVKREAEEDWR